MRALHSIRLVVVLSLCGAVAFSSLAGEDDQDHTGIASVSEQLRVLLPVVVEGGRLKLNQAAWEDNDPAAVELRRKNVAQRLARQHNMKLETITPQMIDNAMAQTSGMVPVEIFQDIVVQIGGYGGSSSSSGRSFNMNHDSRQMRAMLNVDMVAHEFEIRLAEKGNSKRVLAVSDDEHLGFVVNYANASKNRGFVFVQSRSGPASLAAYDGKQSFAVSGESFVELLHKNPQLTLEQFIKPLMSLGVDFPFSRNHPAVKAMVATGFNPAPPEIAAKIQALLKTLDDEDQDVREKAYKDLVPLYPQAILDLSEALKNAQDPEVKRRLENVANAYPALQLAREFVLLEKLQDDREYLLSLLKDPTYKAGIRARLTTLVGKDYGDDPTAWPLNR